MGYNYNADHKQVEEDCFNAIKNKTATRSFRISDMLDIA